MFLLVDLAAFERLGSGTQVPKNLIIILKSTSQAEQMIQSKGSSHSHAVMLERSENNV
jgi:hypothetical protein